MLCLVCVCGGLQQILHFETRPWFSRKDFKTLSQLAYYILVDFSSVSKTHQTHDHIIAPRLKPEAKSWYPLLPSLSRSPLVAALHLFGTVQKIERLRNSLPDTIVLPLALGNPTPSVSYLWLKTTFATTSVASFNRCLHRSLHVFG